LDDEEPKDGNKRKMMLVLGKWRWRIGWTRIEHCCGRTPWWFKQTDDCFW